MDASGEETLASLVADMDHYYNKLVSLYWHQLYTFVSRRLSNPQDAEDIVQEAFVRAYLALERYSTQRLQSLKVRAWLYKITWNVYCNYISRSKTSALLSLDTCEESELLEREDERDEQPDAIFEHIERRLELEALVAALPPHYSVVVSLYYFAELSHQEIADVLNQPIGTVKVYARRGIGLLRKAMATQMHQVG